MLTLAPAVSWEGGCPGRLAVLDQTKLPDETTVLQLERVEQLHDAIRRLAVRGAPAIGVAAGYGVVLGLQGLRDGAAHDVTRELDRVSRYLTTARPTAVNLSWAVARVGARVRREAEKNVSASALVAAALDEAHLLEIEERERCDRIGALGAALLRDGDAVYTHCNTGALAAIGIGTALGVVRAAADQGKKLRVFAGETRPLLQGARLTALELQRAGIPVEIVTDGMCARVFATRKVAAVIVGADRIAANGDVANKIGTCTLAIVARHYGVPFYVAAPLSTLDLEIPDGARIPIEERPPEEILEMGGRRIAPLGVDAFNPAFDVTPASLVTGIITEAGIASPPGTDTIAKLLGKRT
ncbi:MAG TPA: S-methyl-5-thioribose-1-phosphate isomerase [Planctomycetota bacterium]|nr:S-methyl-5-thioribose-1-phosphate isomerase [Planctomycetota bacterium]